MAIKLKWSSLLHLTELEFIPEAPKVLEVSDELVQAISWLTGATGHDRRLLRCTEQGALLTADGWSLLTSVQTDELYPEPNTPDTYQPSVEHQGVLVASSTEIVRLTFVRVQGGATEDIYIPPNCLYWYPHKIYTLTVYTVPADTGTASYVGITALN